MANKFFLSAVLLISVSMPAFAQGLMLDTPPASGQATGVSASPLAPSPQARSIISPAQGVAPQLAPAQDVAPAPQAQAIAEPAMTPPAPLNIARSPHPVTLPPSGYDLVLDLTEQDARDEFAAMDVNHDGQVSFSEFSFGYSRFYPAQEDPSQPSKRFAALDGNGDGVISLKEFIDNRNHPYDDNLTMHWVPDGANGSAQ